MKTHNKFMEEVKEASSLPAQTRKALSEESQSPSDLKAIARQNETATIKSANVLEDKE